MEILRSVVPYPKNIDLKVIDVPVNMLELLQFERIGNNYRSKVDAWPIPCEISSDDYRIKGEYMISLNKSDLDRSVILYLHGGAYVVGSPVAFRHLTSKLAGDTGYDVFAVDYRLAPEHPFPAALHDALAAYLWLINPDHLMFLKDISRKYKYQPKNIFLGGDSAGGGLVMSFLIYLNKYLRYEDGQSIVPLPGAAFMFSPWSDLSMSSSSLRINAEYDYLPRNMIDLHSPIYPGVAHPSYSYILGQNSGRDLPILGSKNLKGDLLYKPESKELVDSYIYHPLISPVYESDFSALPPILIQSGDCEMLRDETIALAYKISKSTNASSSKVRHEIYIDMVHVFQAITSIKSSQIAFENVVNFLDDAQSKGHVDDLTNSINDYFIVNAFDYC
jgi:acetyl esterase/lipase